MLSIQNGTLAISIHAPVKGATYVLNLSADSLVYFNPRSREGSDVKQLLYFFRFNHFNPRSREGSDSKNHQDYSQ